MRGREALSAAAGRSFNLGGGEDFMQHLNPNALQILSECYIEPSLADAKPEQSFQFEREGYFVADRYDHSAQKPVFNKTIGLRDTFAKEVGKG